MILNPYPRPSRALDSHQWQFDAAGNRVNNRGDRKQDNRILYDGERRFEYDAWGNTCKIEYESGPRQGMHILMLYDGLHQLRASQTYNPKAAEEKDRTITVYYHYDALGRRIAKKRVRESVDSAGQAKRQTLQRTCYGWDGDRLVTTLAPNYVAVSTVYEPGSFVPLLRIDTEIDDGKEGRKTRYHYHCNHLGTPVALIEQQTKQVVWQLEIDPWGLTRSLYNPYGIHQPIKMQGQQLDVETGLFYNRYRYYDPKLGRYTTQDPIKLKGGVNSYSYADANPSRHVDSLGLFTSDQHIAITIEALWACSGLTPDQLKKLAWASAAGDWTPTWKDSQAVSNAPWHSMARPGQDAAKAAAETGTFIQEQMSIGSTESVGRAIHAAQDAAAGGHAGNKVYNGEFDLDHFLNDLFPSKDEREKAIAATRKLFPKCQNMCFK